MPEKFPSKIEVVLKNPIVFRAIQNEMQPSMGCTEPVAIGLAVSRTCEYLEQPAEGLDMVIMADA